MRLSTKITLGIMGGVFLISLLFIIGFSFTDRKNSVRQDRQVTISQDNLVPIEIGEFKTVSIDYLSEKSGHDIYIDGCLFVKPTATESNKQELLVSEEVRKYINTLTTNDTLFIRFDWKQMNKDLANANGSSSFRVVHDVNYYLNTSVVDIISNTDMVKINIQDIKTDHIKVCTTEEILINSCEAVSVTPSGNNFKIQNSTIHTLNLDLDKVRGWNVENCSIQEENLTGSGNHRNTISKSETKVMNWIPKDKDARLNLEIVGGEPARFTFK